MIRPFNNAYALASAFIRTARRNGVPIDAKRALWDSEQTISKLSVWNTNITDLRYLAERFGYERAVSYLIEILDGERKF